MEITLNTPALLFPTISLLMLAYTNRFLALANIVRNLHSAYQKQPNSIYLIQIKHLRRRILLIRQMQLFGVLCILLCVICMFLLFQGLKDAGAAVFAMAMTCMMISLFQSLREIHISVGTLDFLLKDLEKEEAKIPDLA